MAGRSGMLSITDLLKVKLLLQEGNFSQRAIARLTGINRNTVNRIAQGKRPDFNAIRKVQKCSSRRSVRPQSGNPRRCGNCGGLVYMPCRLCAIRKFVTKSREDSQVDEIWHRSELLGVELAGKERERYEQIRTVKRGVGEEVYDEQELYIEPTTLSISIETFEPY